MGMVEQDSSPHLIQGIVGEEAASMRDVGSTWPSCVACLCNFQSEAQGFLLLSSLGEGLDSVVWKDFNPSGLLHPYAPLASLPSASDLVCFLPLSCLEI